MGREIRTVPPSWQHPKDSNGRYIPLYDGLNLAARTADWDAQAAAWALGFRADDLTDSQWVPLSDDERDIPYEEWDNPRPDPAEYMPAWPAEFRTHVMMYENATEGTPISPIFPTHDELMVWVNSRQSQQS